MASTETPAPKLFARDIVAYNDEELDRYLEENGRAVAVEDPDNLPEEFIQRLRDRVRRENETAASHPIDLDQVAARLERLQEQSRRSPSLPTTASYHEEEEYREDLRLQRGMYKMLVDDGGRPSHPLSRLEDIVENPGEYREILTFWQGTYPREDDWRVFGRQWSRWRAFRGLQRFARGQRGYDYWRSLWEEKCALQKFSCPEVEENSEENWQHTWRLHQEHHDNHVQLGSSYMPWRLFIKRKGQTISQQGFPEYAEALKERLASHGFTRPFQLDEDAARQDKMTTWIEYLGYEYWWYDYHTGIVRRYQRRHDDAWKELVDSNVLRPGETEEGICNRDDPFEDVNKQKMAERAMDAAKSAVSSAETAMAYPGKYKGSPQILKERLLAARSQLEAAQAEYESIKRRIDCIGRFHRRTREYQIAKRDAERHELLLRWMLEQVPLIEAELNPPNDCGSHKRDRSKVLKRQRNPSEGVDENSQQQSRDGSVNGPSPDRPAATVPSFQEPSPKRLRRTANPSHTAVSDPGDPNVASGTFGSKKDCAPQKRKGQASSDQSPTLKPLRRSARIAERAQRMNAALEPSPRSAGIAERAQRMNAALEPSRRSARIAERAQRLNAAATTATTLTQTPAAALSKPSKKRRAKQGGTKKSSRPRTSKPRGAGKKGRTRS
ncbi:uncharacterized protein EI97DRAFT_462771 [Westerdykella ornata]|uniref:Ankyrin 2,3/unc44 n=1 Tax=Westerdykella ornata TaxID=318751 RepID=A0A6A6J5X4_WESOR|nr:uncharacterized protein EI97DRAFT_462771 [Westerdykella ornata]KAF2271533.1 hypothetical protein EI97DRAFT_462771 [Westerdykella ornata]